MSDVQQVGTVGDDARPRADADPPAEVRRRTDGVLLAVVALGLVVRFHGLGAQSLWYDEWLTTEATADGLGDLLHHVATREGITPPYFLVMWAWARVVGEGEAALRSFSALAGAATVPLAYAVARQVGQSRAVARGAALLVAVNPLLVWYSLEARPYSLLAFLGGLTVWTAIRAGQSGRRVDLWWWGLAGAAAVATHYFALFLVAGQVVALLAGRRVPRRLVLTGTVPVVVVLVALAPFALEQHSHAANRDWISGFALTARLEDAGRTALAGPSPPVDWLWLVVAGSVVVAGAAGFRRRNRGELAWPAALTLLGAAAVVLPLVAAAVGTDVFLGRYLLAAAVPLLVALAALLLAGARRWAGTVGLVLVAAVWVAVDVAVATDPSLQRADWRAVAAVAGSGSSQRVLVVDRGGNQSNPVSLYLPGADLLGEGERVSVDQIDVLGLRPGDAPCNFFVGRACAFVFLGGPLPPPLAEQFSLDGHYELDQFVVRRYRSEVPVSVDPSDLVRPERRAGAYVWAP